MAERFNRLFSLSENLYSQYSPILISAGALLKDTVSGNVIAQLKYKNLSDKTLIALKIQIRYYDVTGQECLGTKDHEYLDLQIQSGQYFGSDKAIVISNPLARSFSISGLLALFADKETWNWESEHVISPLPKQQTLAELLGDDELKIQYKLKVNQSAQFVPIEYKGAWRCSCGEVNSAEICSACSAQKAVAFRALDLPMLVEEKNARLNKAEEDRIERERIAEARRLEQEQKSEEDRIVRETKAKHIKQIVAWVVPVAVVGIVIFLLVNVIIPSSKYKKALSMIESKDYVGAQALIEELGDYKDSKTLILDSKYEQAKSMIESKDYVGAQALIEELGDYKDSKTLILDSKYEEAKSMIESKDYFGAQALFEEIGNYQDSSKLLQECNYQIAVEHFNANDYDNARELFLSLGSYKESEDYLKKNNWTEFITWANSSKNTAHIGYKSNGDQYTVTIATEDNALVLTYMHNPATLGVALVASWGYGAEKATLAGKSEIAIATFGITMKLYEKASGLWNIKAYKKGQGVNWEKYEVSGIDADGDYVNDLGGSGWLMSNPKVELEEMAKALEVILAKSELNITINDLGFDNY